MYRKYIEKPFNKQTWDCAHLASKYLKDNIKLDTTIPDNYSRDYEQHEAYEKLMDGFTKMGFVVVDDTCYKEGDLIISKNTYTCWVCVNEKLAISIRSIKFIKRIIDNSTHLRHGSLL
jgi:3-isopropylmalate dehydratase small subunit